MNATKLNQKKDYPNFPEFKEFNIPLKFIHKDLIITLQKLRNLSSIPITPSPISAGWARLNGSSTSRHYAVNRLSDAGDIFPARGKLMTCWTHAQAMPNIGGLGLYSDTKGVDGYSHLMLHIDLRSHPRVYWVRENGRYWYLHSNPREFWRAVASIISQEGNY